MCTWPDGTPFPRLCWAFPSSLRAPPPPLPAGQPLPAGDGLPAPLPAAHPGLPQGAGAVPPQPELRGAEALGRVRPLPRRPEAEGRRARPGPPRLPLPASPHPFLRPLRDGVPGGPVMVGAGPAGRRGRLSLPYSPDMDDDLYSAAYLQHFVCGDTVADRHPSLCRNTARSVCCGGKGEGQDGCSNIGIGTVFVMRPHHLATGCFSKNMKETSPTGTVFGVKKIFTMTVSLNGHIKLWAPPQREAKGAFHLKKCHNFAKWYGIGWAIAQPVLSEQIFLCPIPCPVVNCRLKLGVVVNSLSFLGHFIILLKEPKFLTFCPPPVFPEATLSMPDSLGSSLATTQG